MVRSSSRDGRAGFAHAAVGIALAWLTGGCRDASNDTDFAHANGADGSWTLTGYVDDCEPVCDDGGCSGCPGMTPVLPLELDLSASTTT